MAAHCRRREAGEIRRPGSTCRPWSRLCHRRDDLSAARNHGAEHRLLYDWRGTVHRSVRYGASDARGDGSRADAVQGRLMIIGIGSDLIDITRVAKVIERHGDRFLDRIFTEAER